MKKVTLVKRGFGAVVMEQGVYRDGTKWYTITENGITKSMLSADAMNLTYGQYLKAGWTVKPETVKKETAKKAPQGPSWDFGPDGFDRNEYLRIARENGWTYSNQYGTIKVYASKREQVYLLMGGKKIR